MIAARTHVFAESPVRFQAQLTDTLAEYLAAFDILGRLHVLQSVKRKTGRALPLNTRTPIRAQVFEETTVLGFESVPPEGAIRRIRNLTGMTRAAFDGLAQRYKMQAFTVAGVSDVRLIEQIQQQLVKTLETGATQEEFARAVRALMSQAGVEQLTTQQLQAVFNTNAFTAYANGRFEQMKDPAVAAALPYWKYVTVGDGRVRPAHEEMDGFVARQNDPIWRRWYPPAGFNCRCTVVAILASEAPEDADVPGAQRVNVQPDPGFGGLGGIVQ